MPKPLPDRLGLDIGRKHMAGVAVPLFVQTNLPFLEEGGSRREMDDYGSFKPLRAAVAVTAPELL
jgi:hypothetical protein